MSERVALVTGASRGIGRACALALAGTGFAVAVNHRTDARGAKETLEAIHGAGGEGVAVSADVREPASVEAMFGEIEDALGPVSALVNNAGVRADGLAMRITDDDWRTVLDTNLTGTFNCSRRALRSMVRLQWGRIVNIASIAGMRGSTGQANYSAAKAGVIGLTRTLAREVARKNVTVNAVAPGLIDTDMTGSLPAARRKALVEQIPMGRAGAPEDVAGVVVFLCSEQASYLTGSLIAIDGGMTA